jgi:hypothetical protein
MTQRSYIIRAAAVLSSLTLLAAYVWHSHVTPNTPPPDSLGLSTIELTSEPETIEFDGFVNYGQNASPGKSKRDGLRIISSKVINQPIFSVRKATYSFSKPGPFPGSEDVIVNVEMPYFRIEGGLPTFDLFGERKTSTPPP